MTHSNKSIEDKILMQKLKDIILREDRDAFAELEETINNPEKLSKKVSPIIEERIDFLKQNFPAEYQQVIDKILTSRLENHKKEIMDELSLSMGKVIKKYITIQFELLKERIDDGLKSAFSAKSVKQRFKAYFYGVDEKELILSKMIKASIEEVYIIQKESGLLIGSASRNHTIDKDVIAGMLTAIKSFVEDAFQKESEDLEMIRYGSYKIFLQNFHSFYIAIALSGAISPKEQENLSSLAQDFAEEQMTLISNITDEKVEILSKRLDGHFINTP